MDNHNHHHASGFGNGFVLGLIVGAAIVFFFFTKKGRQIFKMISEEGIEGIEEFKELLDADDEEEFDDEPVQKAVSRVEAAVTPIKRTAKRFFRGVPKRRK